MTVAQQLESGVSRHRAGRLAEAEAIYRQVLAQQPDNADALRLLGALAEAHNNLGNVLAGEKQFDQAIASYRRAIGLKPDFADAFNNLGNALKGKGQIDEAIASFGQAMRLKPGYAEAHNNLANALRGNGQLDGAISSYREAIRLKSGYAEAHNNLGNALMDTGRLDEAIASYREAIRLKPDYAKAHDNLGNALKDMGQLDEAIALHQKAIGLKPDFVEAHSNLVFAIHFHASYDARMIQEEHQRWNQVRAEPLKKFIQPHGNNRDPDRRLRIGYVSGDFREHVVGRNLLPILREHDHKQVEIFCYANRVREDQLTLQIRDCADSWRNIAGLSDSRGADLIRTDEIDIFVDLAVHTAGNRLLIFARKPAPVQVTYLGYCSSTGLEAMDYRLSDPYLDPPDSDLSVYGEETIRLPESYWCYTPLGPTPEPSPPPVEATGYITFGCLNKFAKVPAALDLWAADSAKRGGVAAHRSLVGGNASGCCAKEICRQWDFAGSPGVSRPAAVGGLCSNLWPDRYRARSISLGRGNHYMRCPVDGSADGDTKRANGGGPRRGEYPDQHRLAGTHRSDVETICGDRRRARQRLAAIGGAAADTAAADGGIAADGCSEICA